MSNGAQQVEDYLAALEEPKRSTLSELRLRIRALVPEAEEGISYGIPCFRLRGRVFAGYAAFSRHCSYLPHSGSVLGELGEELAGYSMTRSALHFPVDQPLPVEILRRLIEVRLAQAGMGKPTS